MILRSQISVAALVGLLTTSQAATITFNEFFNGSSLDTTEWAASTPFYDSSVSVSGGNLILNNRGRVLTKDSFNDPIDMLMGFQITGSQFESFKIGLRTDGYTNNGSAEFDNGIFASFRIRSDTGATSGNITLYNQEHGTEGTPDAVTTPQSIGTFALTTNQTYVIRLRDDGSSVSLFINDLSNPFLTIFTPDSYGSQIGFYNREGAGAGSSISAGSQVKVDFVSITSHVPEAGMSGLYVLAGIVGLIATARRMRVGGV